MIKECGGRFLARVDYENYWVEVSHSIAYRKVGHAFRSKVRISKNYSGGTTKTSALPNNMLSDAPTTVLLLHTGDVQTHLNKGIKDQGSSRQVTKRKNHSKSYLNAA